MERLNSHGNSIDGNSINFSNQKVSLPQICTPRKLNFGPITVESTCSETSLGPCVNLTSNSLLGDNNFFNSSDRKRNTYDQKNDLPDNPAKKVASSEPLKTLVIENTKIVYMVNIGTKESVKHNVFKEQNGIFRVYIKGFSRFSGIVVAGEPNGFGVLQIKKLPASLSKNPNYIPCKIGDDFIISGDFAIENGHLFNFGWNGYPRHDLLPKEEPLPRLNGMETVPNPFMHEPVEERNSPPYIKICPSSIVSDDVILAFGFTEQDTVYHIYNIAYSNGDLYQGMLRKGKPHGEGTLTRNGMEISGVWSDGKLSDRLTQVGKTKSSDKKQLAYLVRYANGDQYYGEADERIPHGTGTLIHDGKEYKGQWEQGELIKRI